MERKSPGKGGQRSVNARDEVGEMSRPPLKEVEVTWDYGWILLCPICKETIRSEGVDYPASTCAHLRVMIGDGPVVEGLEYLGKWDTKAFEREYRRACKLAGRTGIDEDDDLRDLDLEIVARMKPRPFNFVIREIEQMPGFKSSVRYFLTGDPGSFSAKDILIREVIGKA